MALALFDLDNTLLNGDSDHSWGLFLSKVGAVDANIQKQKQDYYYQQYVAGTLDILEFLEYQLKPLTQFSLEQLQQWRTQFIEQDILPIIAADKVTILKEHQNAGDKVVIITATNDFITQPIAEELGVDTLIATQAERSKDEFTGKVAGTPCFQHGKITRLNEWLEDQDFSMENSWFYSDSYNDLPLLELVDNPVAVTPDDKLRQHAEQFHWKIID